jgi:hypothetical protein
MSWLSDYLPDGLEKLRVPDECDIQVFDNEFLDSRLGIGSMLAADVAIIAMQFCLAIQAMLIR